MTALVVGIFIASLLGSLHCAGMCGAFVAIALRSEGRQWPLQVAYHGGRLVTYTLLGVAAGAAGKLLDLSSALAGVRPVAAAAAGATLLAFGLVSLLRIYGMSLARIPAPAFFRNVLASAHRHAMNRPPVVRAALIGLLTTLLPCGWLYAFAVTAAGTASPLRGALVMAVFWVGTLPMLVTLGAGLRSLAGAFGRRIPAITCVALMALGLFTLINRSRLDPAAIAAKVSGPQTAEAPPCCVEHDR